MTLQQIDWLQLPSQQHILDRLHHLMLYTASPVILLAGEVGSGRTVITQRLLNELDPSFHIAYLAANGKLAAERFRESLLSQLKTNGVFSLSDPLPSSVQRLFEKESVKLAVIIDDVDLLPATLIEELIELHWLSLGCESLEISLVLIASSLWQDVAILYSVRTLDRGSFFELALEPLSKEEVQALFTSGQSLQLSAGAISQQIKALTGENMEQQNQQVVEDAGTSSSFDVKKNWGRYLLIAILVIAVALLILSYVLPPKNKPQSVEAPLHQLQALPSPVETAPSAAGATQGAAVADEWKKDEVKLPPAVTTGTVTAESKAPDKHRVVLSDHVVDALIKEDTHAPAAIEPDPNAKMAKMDDTAEIAAAKARAKARAKAEAMQNQEMRPTSTSKAMDDGVEALTSPTEMAKSDSPNAMAAAAKKNVKSVTHKPVVKKPVKQMAPAHKGEMHAVVNAELPKKNPKHYTIQLGGFSDLKAAHNFIQKHQLAKGLVYQTRFNGKPWFVVIEGDYASRDVAKQQLGKLSAQLALLHPWVKPMSLVQRELRK